MNDLLPSIPAFVRAAIEKMPNAAYMKDRDGRYVFANRAACLCAERDDLVGLVDEDFLAPEEARRMRERDAQILASGRAQTLVERVRIGGQERTFVSTKTPMADASGRVVGLFGISQDVTAELELADDLEEARERAEALSRTASEAFVVHDGERVLAASEAMARLTGWPLESAVGSPITTFLPTESLRVALAHAGEGGEQAYPLQVRHRDGRLITMEVRSAPTRYRGHPARVVALQDVTQRVQAEGQLQRARQYLDAIGESVIAVDEAHLVTYWNSGAQRIYGWTAQETIGRNALDLLPTRMTSAQLDALREALDRGEAWTGEVEVRRKDGAFVPVRVTDTPVRDAGGRRIGTIGVSEDITREREARDALARGERHLAEAQALVGIGSWELRPDRGIDSLSAEACRLFGFPPDAAPPDPKRFLDLVERDDRPALLGLRGRLEKGVPVRGHDFRIRRADTGELRTLTLHVAASRDASGTMRVLGTVQDVTQLRQLERAVEDAHRVALEQERLSTLGTLVAGINHEIANALTYLTMSEGVEERALEELLAEQNLSKEARERAQEVHAAVQSAKKGIEHLTNIAAGLRTFYRASPGNRALVAPEKFVETALMLGRSRIPVGVEVHKEYHAQRKLLVNEGSLVQVILNLLLNAGEAIGEAGKGHVVVRTRDEDDQVVVEVEDDGPGIPPDVAARLFTPFYTTKRNGTGLGLNVSRRIAQEHGGTLAFSSQLGKGATFVLRLPVAR